MAGTRLMTVCMHIEACKVKARHTCTGGDRCVKQDERPLLQRVLLCGSCAAYKQRQHQPGNLQQVLELTQSKRKQQVTLRAADMTP